jgi:hypothetical protein
METHSLDAPVYRLGDVELFNFRGDGFRDAVDPKEVK